MAVGCSTWLMSLMELRTQVTTCANSELGNTICYHRYLSNSGRPKTIMLEVASGARRESSVKLGEASAVS